MTHFDGSGKEAFGKHREKRRNCLCKQFLLFQQCFLLYQRQKSSFLLHLICRLQMLSIRFGSKFCRVGMGKKKKKKKKTRGSSAVRALASKLQVMTFLTFITEPLWTPSSSWA